jgi:hypothetical protein
VNGLIKHPVDPLRIRPMPRQFGAVDRRLVYGDWTRRLSLEALALYVFLICVADEQGLSYYSDRRIGELLSLDPSDVVQARERLLGQGLILYQRPLYQVLDLPERP